MWCAKWPSVMKGAFKKSTGAMESKLGERKY